MSVNTFLNKPYKSSNSQIKVNISGNNSYIKSTAGSVVRDIQFSVRNEIFCWRNSGDSDWQPVFALTDITGKSLEFIWQGTQLGVRQEDSAEYSYIDLQGVQGEIGVGVASGSINASGHLILTLTNDIHIDCGEMPLPPVKDFILEYSTHEEFPIIGDAATIYLATAEGSFSKGLMYRWDYGVQDYVVMNDPLTGLDHIDCGGAI